MCGRFTLKAPVEELVDLFGPAGLLESPGGGGLEPLVPRFNVAPSQDVAVVCNWQPRKLEWMRWGLIPGWADSASEGNRHINARSETAGERAMFRTCLSRRRCLVLADGFYEWKRDGKAKIPMYIRALDGKPFAFAGVWNGWLSPAGELVRSVAILTRPADDVVAPIHHRMPVILPPENYGSWLDEGLRDVADVSSIMENGAAVALKAHTVSTRVNSPHYDDEACIEPCEPSLPRGTLPLFPDL